VKRDFNLEKRKYILGGSVVLVVLIYLIRLFSLQIMSEDYKKYADWHLELKVDLSFDANNNCYVSGATL
jgi:hypothetical protein